MSNPVLFEGELDAGLLEVLKAIYTLYGRIPAIKYLRRAFGANASLLSAKASIDALANHHGWQASSNVDLELLKESKSIVVS